MSSVKPLKSPAKLVYFMTDDFIYEAKNLFLYGDFTSRILTVKHEGTLIKVPASECKLCPDERGNGLSGYISIDTGFITARIKIDDYIFINILKSCYNKVRYWSL